MATSQVSPVTVSMTRPSTHQPTFVYDQTAPAGRTKSISATSRASAPSSESRCSAKPNSSAARSGSPERFASRSRTVATSAHAPPRSSCACAETGSSSDRRPASANPAMTVATIDLVNDPTLKRVSAVTASPVPMLARSVGRGRDHSPAEDPDRGPGNRMPVGVFREQGSELVLDHGTILAIRD